MIKCNFSHTIVTKSYRDLSGCIGIGTLSITKKCCTPFALYLRHNLAIEKAEKRGDTQTLKRHKNEKMLKTLRANGRVQHKSVLIMQ